MPTVLSRRVSRSKASVIGASDAIATARAARRSTFELGWFGSTKSSGPTR